MRSVCVALLLAFASAVSADTADLTILSMNVTKTSVETGERLTVSMRWRNNGPDFANDVVATLGGNGSTIGTGTGTSGWPCEPSFGGDSFICRSGFPAGAEAEMVVTLLAPPSTTPPAFVVNGEVRASTADPLSSNNTMQRTVSLTAASVHANLSIGPSEQTLSAAAGAVVAMPLVVTNHGPDTAHDLTVLLSSAPGSLIPVHAEGDGWACRNATHSPQLVSCLRTTLAAGTPSTITLTAAAPVTDGQYAFYARVSAERSFDATAGDLQATALVRVGAVDVPKSRRILVPLLPNDAPGVNGSLWRTEITALIDSDTPIATPSGAVPPLRVPFNAKDSILAGFSGQGGAFLSPPAVDGLKIHLNSRVYDLSRIAETAGTAIPIVPEETFTNGTNVLLGIPVSAHYRHTLRVYALDREASVTIRVYANDETTPRATITRTAYLQLDPAALLALDGVTTLHLEIDPVDPSTRIWSFVSATNNDTHHVTTFSAN
jgi:hypothetical protein